MMPSKSTFEFSSIITALTVATESTHNKKQKQNKRGKKSKQCSIKNKKLWHSLIQFPPVLLCTGPLCLGDEASQNVNGPSRHFIGAQHFSGKKKITKANKNYMNRNTEPVTLQSKHRLVSTFL